MLRTCWLDLVQSELHTGNIICKIKSLVDQTAVFNHGLSDNMNQILRNKSSLPPATACVIPSVRGRGVVCLSFGEGGGLCVHLPDTHAMLFTGAQGTRQCNDYRFCNLRLNLSRSRLMSSALHNPSQNNIQFPVTTPMKLYILDLLTSFLRNSGGCSTMYSMFIIVSA